MFVAARMTQISDKFKQLGQVSSTFKGFTVILVYKKQNCKLLLKKDFLTKSQYIASTKYITYNICWSKVGILNNEKNEQEMITI